MNRFGDLFLIMGDCLVPTLNVGGGTLTKLAENRDDFCRKIDAGDSANQWLVIPLVGADSWASDGRKSGSAPLDTFHEDPR